MSRASHAAGRRFCRSSGSAAWACSPETGSRASSPGPLGAAGSVVPQGLKDILPIGGWRIYAINPPWPEFHPAQLQARGDRARPQSGEPLVGRPDEPPDGPADHRLPLRDRLDGRRRPLAGRAAPDDLGHGRAAARGPLRQLRLARGALRRHAVAPADDTPGRHACPSHGRCPAHPRPRRAGAARDPRDVRLQEREVADQDRARAEARARVLGGERLRRRRLGWAAPTATEYCAGSAARSGRRTGSWPRRSSS